MAQFNSEYIEHLKGLARTAAKSEDEDFEMEGIDMFAGGNIDDAYEAGRDDGEIFLARETLTQLGIEW